MKYDFHEKSLGISFAAHPIQETKKLIDASVCFTVLSMPGMGVSVFLRYLATTDLAYFVFIDAYALSKPTKRSFFALLLKELGEKTIPSSDDELVEKIVYKVKALSQQHKKIVIIINRFDQLRSLFDKSFFGNLQEIQIVDPTKIIFITAANRPLSEIAPEAISGSNIKLFSKSFYLKPYDEKDISTLLKISPTEFMPNNEDIKKAVALSGGHYQLLQLLLKTERPNNPLLDKFIELQLNEIFSFLTYDEKKTLQKIALGKKIQEIDNFLVNIGLVKKEKDEYALFSSLFTEYVKSRSPLKLPIKEEKLFNLLKEHEGHGVTKDEIFNTIWVDETDEASDWALNSLIYRIRKNPVFVSMGYAIESHKKQGYMLIKN